MPGCVPSPGYRQEPDDVVPTVRDFSLLEGSLYMGQDNETSVPKGEVELL